MRLGKFWASVRLYGGAMVLVGCGGAEPAADSGEESLAASSAEVVVSSSIASGLDGAMFTAPCGADSSREVCRTSSGACPARNAADPALSGALMTDKTITLGGDSWRTYTVNLRVQGVVEPRNYSGGVDANSAALHPAANGFYTAGIPATGNDYNVYMVRTSNPARSYYLNALVPPYNLQHSTFGVDFTAKIQAKGRSTIRLVASDANCTQIKNCGPVDMGQDRCEAPITKIPTQRAIDRNPDFNFNQPYNGQWLVMTVTSVTTP